MRKVLLTRRERIRHKMDYEINLAIKSNFHSVRAFCIACGMDESGYQNFIKKMKSQKGLCTNDLITIIMKTGWMEEEFKDA